jgi:paraquat-inducible protein A
MGEPTALRACHCFGLVQRLPPLPPGHRARCPRCWTEVRDPARRARGSTRTVAAALAALVLYPLAVTQPIMVLEQLGHQREASIWTGSVGLLRKGEWFVGSVVLICSLVIPLAKLLGLLTITLGRRWLKNRHRATTYRLIEWTGRWGMLDVLLISVVVAWIKMGDVIDVQPGPAAVAFALVVLLSLFATAWFDPYAIWDEDEGRTEDR